MKRRTVPARWRERLAPKPPARERGRLSSWGRIRRLLWSWWPWAIVAVVLALLDEGAWASAAAGFALLAYLLMPGEAPPRYGLDHDFGVEDDRFTSTIAGASGVPFSSGNDIRVLNNGDEFYPVMLEAIDSARMSITIEAYIYWAGEIGMRFARALADKSASGVQVKILLDAVGSATIGDEILETLEGGGCQLAWYNPLKWYSIGRINRRTHRKSLIIDGRVAFTGGAGIADPWLGNAEDPDHWRDIQIRVEGPAAAPLQTGFAQNWLETTGELISGEAFYSAPARPDRVCALTLMSSPETGASTVRLMYYLSIVCARRSIDIANPYFVPDEVARETLIEAQRRGVRVRVMVSGVHNDNWLARQNSVRLYGPLLDAGIELFEFNATMLHHKTMVVDGIWVTVGTANFDTRSFAHNEESNVCAYDRPLAEQMGAIFERDLARCDRVTLAAWKKRSLWARSCELVASLLEAQV